MRVSSALRQWARNVDAAKTVEKTFFFKFNTSDSPRIAVGFFNDHRDSAFETPYSLSKKERVFLLTVLATIAASEGK